MNDGLAYALLPWIIIASTSLVLMLATAIKRNHFHISVLSSLGLLLALIVQVNQIGELDYKDSLLVFDGTTTLLSALLIFVSLLLSLLIYPWLNSLKDPKEEYYMLFLLATVGALVVCASSHFASFFLGLELLSLSIVPMVAYVDRDQKALEAGIKYLVLSAVASAFMLMAIAIIYFYTGTLSIEEIIQHPTLVSETKAQVGGDFIYNLAIVMLLVGLAFKLSLAPCHLWVADLIEGSPLPTAALLATISKAAIFVVLIRLFTLGEWHLQTDIILILSVIAGASMIIGNFLALLQNNLLRLLAFSSIAHFGYILLALLSIKPDEPLSTATTLSHEAAIYYLFAYLVTVVGTFSILMLLDKQSLEEPGSPDTFTISRLKGLFWRKPSMALVLTLLFLSLAGIPLTIGFVGKFYLTLSAVNAQLWSLLAVLVLSSIVGLYYYLRIIMMMVEKNPEEHNAHEKIQQQRPYLLHQMILALVGLLVLGIGIFPGELASIIERVI